jgi:hypothetical protein
VWASVTTGNNYDEFLTREPEDTYYRNLLGAELQVASSGQENWEQQSGTSKTALVTRFSDFDLRTEIPKM